MTTFDHFGPHPENHPGGVAPKVTFTGDEVRWARALGEHHRQKRAHLYRKSSPVFHFAHRVAHPPEGSVFVGNLYDCGSHCKRCQAWLAKHPEVEVTP